MIGSCTISPHHRQLGIKRANNSRMLRLISTTTFGNKTSFCSFRYFEKDVSKRFMSKQSFNKGSTIWNSGILKPSTSFASSGSFTSPRSSSFSFIHTNTENEELRKENDELKAKIEALEKKLKKRSLVQMLRDFGFPFVVLWGSAYGSCFAGIYLGIEYELLGEFDIIQWLKDLQGNNQYFDLDNVNPKYANLTAALVLNEVVEVVRFPLILAATPAFSRWWAKTFSSKKLVEKEQNVG